MQYNPLVTGALYNGAHQAPYSLPANKTRTTLKSQSSPGVGGYNELRMEDKKGSEQLFVHGQKDVDLYVKNDRMESIDHDRHRIVTAAALEKIGNDHNRKITANHNLKVGKTLSQTVGGNVNQKTGQNWLEKVGVDYSLKAGTSVVLDAGLSITLKGGGGTIALDPSGVSITGSQVRINSGGGAGSAKGASPTAPQTPRPLDSGAPGSTVNTLGADARFKQKPVAFDQSKAKEIDESALKALEKTYVHGPDKPASAGTPNNSNSAQASTVAASTGAAALAASLARVHSDSGATATEVYSPERIEQLLSGRGLGGQMSRHNGERTEAAALKEMGVTAKDTVVDVSGLERDQKLDAVFNETGYYLSDDTADAVVAAVDNGDDLLVITDAVNEGITNAKTFIASQPEVKAYRDNLEAAIQDPEGSAYGGGPGYIGGLAEGERLVSNILTVNSDKMPAGLKDASTHELMLDAAGLALSGAPAVGMMRGAGKVVPGKNFKVSGAAAEPRFKPVKNLNGVVRTPEEALALADKYGIEIPHDDVKIVFMKSWKRQDADAEYFDVGNGFYKGTEKVTWDDFVMKQGPHKDKLVVRVNPGILDSDEAILSTLGHEMHEVNSILKMFDQRDSIPISEIARQINTRKNGGLANNLHEQAWDESDKLIKRMREQNL